MGSLPAGKTAKQACRTSEYQENDAHKMNPSAGRYAKCAFSDQICPFGPRKRQMETKIQKVNHLFHQIQCTMPTGIRSNLVDGLALQMTNIDSCAEFLIKENK